MTRLTFTIVATSALLFACGKKQEAPASAFAAISKTAVYSNANPMPLNPTATAAGGKFEGEIVVDVKDEAGQKLPASVTFDIKGDKVRYEPTAASVHAIDDTGAQHAYVISDAKKAYTSLDTRSAADDTKGTPATRLEKSNREETVTGLRCEDWTIDDGNERVDVCAAKDIAFFDLAGDPKPGKAEPSWARVLTMKKAFPLRLVVHDDRSGRETYRAEAFEVSWKKVDDSEFQVPKEFHNAELASDAKMASLP
jgi:hypothetical protein